MAYDAVTGRYSITNNQARRYLNEVGAFGRNAFDAEWRHSDVAREGADGTARYAIRNASRGGNAWWLAAPGEKNILYVNEAPTVETVFTWRFAPVQ